MQMCLKKDPDNSKLGQLVHKQRSGYIIYNYGKKKKKNLICEERINKLEGIELSWVGESFIKQQPWDECFDGLKLFKSKHGHAYVTQTHLYYPKISPWVNNQRYRYRKEKSGNNKKQSGDARRDNK